MAKGRVQKKLWTSRHPNLHHRITDARRSIFLPYTVAMGQAAMQWNLLQDAMGHLFLTLMGGGYIAQFAAIWGSAPSDRAKRSMLLVALYERQEFKEPNVSEYDLLKKQRIKELHDLVDGLEGRRNQTVHAPLILAGNPLDATYGHIVPNQLFRDRHAKALAAETRGILKEFRYCRDYARILGQFALDLELCLSLPGRPLPDKPRPPYRGEKSMASSRRQQTQAKAVRPRPASRG